MMLPPAVPETSPIEIMEPEVIEESDMFLEPEIADDSGMYIEDE